jgi:putative DNA primase/helicase
VPHLTKALEEGVRLARMAARWCQDHANQLSEDPPLPSELFNRTADNWRPLFAIADLVRGGWFARLSVAAARLMPDDDSESRGVRLLVDIKAVFGSDLEGISSAHLVDALNAIETSPWAEINKGKPLTQNGLARLLKLYRMRPGDVWVGSPPRSVKGYRRDAFAEVWRRYCPDGPPESTARTRDPQRNLRLR